MLQYFIKKYIIRIVLIRSPYFYLFMQILNDICIYYIVFNIKKKKVGIMMRNIRLVIEYDGSRYDGWQGNARANRPSIKEKIEEVLGKMEGKKVLVQGAQRTESGVHAYGQIANFTTETNLKAYEIKHYLNRYLPTDIVVIRADEVNERFHSAFSAKSFKYEYKISCADVPSAFDRKYVYYSFKKLDGASMKKAASRFVGINDLKAFSDNPRMKKSTVREIFDIDVYYDEKDVSITIHADDFWPNMARIIVGTLIDVGLGKIKVEDIDKIIDNKDRSMAGETAQAHGLYLLDVLYD